MSLGQHGATPVSAVASQKEGSGLEALDSPGPSVYSFHFPLLLKQEMFCLGLRGLVGGICCNALLV